MNVSPSNSTKPGAMLRSTGDGQVIECGPLNPPIESIAGKPLAELAQKSVVYQRAAELALDPLHRRVVNMSKVGEREVLIQVYDSDRASSFLLTIPGE